MRKLVSFLLLASAGVRGASFDVAKAGMDPERLARIPARMKTFVEKGTIAGAVMLIERHGVVASLDAVGYQDLESRKPMRADTIFQIMSMTKPVTATGIMILLEEGKLALSDPVEKHLPEFRGQWLIESQTADRKSRTLKRPSRPITIRDLLTHTSGMPGTPPEGAKEILQKMDMPLKDAVAIYSQQPLDFEPGTKWQYSNSGIATLGRIIEVESGMAYEKFLDERIFRPLGMKDSFFFTTPERTERIAMVYKIENGKLKRSGAEILGGDPALYRRGAKYSGPEYGLYSTAHDLSLFYQMMLNGGTLNGKRILSKASVEAATALHTGEIEPAGHSAGMGYGLAWTVVRDPLGTLQLQSIGTFGHGGAFGTQGWVDPKKDLVGVFLIQRSSGGDNSES
ncbi:MAG TPA: serine hydrolase domain-containing protein, partial [Bryobacteraceae bacterium]|nr:serine hydrolase domain-containing protein [Bryobacteraceae bacterium]